MKGQRPLIGTRVKAGFLTLHVVGHIHNGRLLRNAIGTKYYWQINYGGLHSIDFERDAEAAVVVAKAAEFDPVVASFLNNIRRSR